MTHAPMRSTTPLEEEANRRGEISSNRTESAPMLPRPPPGVRILHADPSRSPPIPAREKDRGRKGPRHFHRRSGPSAPQSPAASAHGASARTCPAPSVSLPLPRVRIRQPSGHILEETDNGLDAIVKVLEAELLVRRVQIVIRQPKPHHERRNLEVTLEVTHDRDRSS